MRLLIIALLVAGCSSDDFAYRPETREDKIARHCAELGTQVSFQALQPPIVYDARGAAHLGWSGGWAAGQAKARYSILVENDCRLRYGLSPR